MRQKLSVLDAAQTHTYRGTRTQLVSSGLSRTFQDPPDPSWPIQDFPGLSRTMDPKRLSSASQQQVHLRIKVSSYWLYWSDWCCWVMDNHQMYFKRVICL